MERFRAEVTFLFAASSLKVAEGALPHLEKAAEDAGFTLEKGTVVPVPPDDPAQLDDDWTGYGPPKPEAG
jgi:hypothetical protein